MSGLPEKVTVISPCYIFSQSLSTVHIVVLKTWIIPFYHFNPYSAGIDFKRQNLTPMVSPPQMPVPLKRMYNANIPRSEITTFVPNCPPMSHTIIKPKLSFFKNCFENGMLTSCVLSYAPMLVKRSVLPRSPEIFLRPFQKRHKSFSPHVSIRKSHITVIPHITDSENSVCLQFIHIISTSCIFLNSPEAETTI